MAHDTDRPETADARRLGEVAVRYAEHGWPVIPLHTPGPHGCSCTSEVCTSPGKHPRTRHGLHDATVEVGQIHRWWGRWPDANIGVVTGRPSGLLVLDIDLPDGPSQLHRLEAAHGPLPRTCTQRTGSGGRQLLFAHPDDEIGNRAGLVDGIDIRGDGGYIVVPPSRHVFGSRYRWMVKTPPITPPGWLVDRLTRRHDREPDAPRRPAVREVSTEGVSRYAAVAVDRELQQLATAREGSRNHALNRAAFNLGQLVGAGLLDGDVVTARLERVAADIGLGPRETRRTIASGLAAGAARPRPIEVAFDHQHAPAARASQRPPYRARVRRR